MRAGRALLTALLFVSLFLAGAQPGTSSCPLSARQCAGPRTPGAFVDEATSSTVYDMAKSPNQACGSSDPVVVEAQFHMTHLDSVDQRLGQVTLGGYLRQWWRDQRLAYNTTANGGCFDMVQLPPTARPEYMIWTPNLYVDNMVKASDEDAVPQLLEISPDGSIWWSKMTLVTVKVTMNFHKLPFDSHDVAVVLASYSLRNSVVRLVGKGGTPGQAQSGIGITSEILSSSMWEIQDNEALKPEGMTTQAILETKFSGSWDYLTVRFKISRKFKFFVEQVMLQDFLFLSVSYAGFFINPTVAPARAAMAVIPVLIMRTLANFVFQGLPQLSYSVWLADYLMVSMWLCVLCVAQFAITQFCLLKESRGDAYYKKLMATEKEMRKIVEEARRRGIVTLELLEQLQPREGPDGTLVSWRFKEKDASTPASSANGGEAGAVRLQAVTVAVSTNSDQPDAVKSEPSALRRQLTELGQHDISEASVCVLERAQQEFKRFDRDRSGRLAPHEIRLMLLTFNIHVTAEDIAVSMCKFLRDRFTFSPKDPFEASLNLGEFLEFLYDIDDYLIGVPDHMKHPFSKALPFSRCWDIAAQWFFPVLVVIKTAVFFAIIGAYRVD